MHTSVFLENQYFSADSVDVFRFEPELKRKKRGYFRLAFPKQIFIDKRLVFQVIDHHIQVAIVVEICINGAVGKGSFGRSDLCRQVIEMQLTCIAKKFVGQFDTRHFIYHCQFFSLDATGRILFELKSPVFLKFYKVDIIHAAWNAVADEKILEAIAVEIHPQRRPGPVGGSDACKQADFTKRAVAVVELQVVAGILVVIAMPQFVLIQAVIIFTQRTFQDKRVFWQHIQ